MNSAMTSDYVGYRLIFGMDANVYEKESKKTQSFTGFVDAYKQMMLQSCFGDKTDPSSFTTYNARTYLQAQIQKACKKSEKRECGDVNPKDFILFFPGSFLSSFHHQRQHWKEIIYRRHGFPNFRLP